MAISRLTNALVLLSGTAIAKVGWKPTVSRRCDVNQDAGTNVQDVQNLVNRGVALAVSDLDGDGAVKVGDVQLGLLAAAGFCPLDPHSSAVGSVPFAPENCAPPVPAGPRSLCNRPYNPLSRLSCQSPDSPAQFS